MTDKLRDPPTIDLDGARLRPLRVADTDALYAYLRDPVVTELTSYPVVSVPMVEAMIERSGFVREGCLRSLRVCRGQPHDFYIYSLLRLDWAAAQPGVAADGAAS
jgi:RimJ/RimL family protein N-acetyltransferase